MQLRATLLLAGLTFLAAASPALWADVASQSAGTSYQQMTAKEAEKLLADSPWARTEAGLVKVGKLDPMVEVADTTITVQLRSALPIRQAIARLSQIREKYDQKSDQDRASIDSRNKELLECSDCDDYYIVSMTPGAGSRSELPAFLNGGHTSFDTVRQNVMLENEKHERRELKKFTGPKFGAGEALFFFARRDRNGNSLIGPDSRTVIISFDPRVFDWKKATTTKFKFDVARMIVDGKVAF